MPSAFQVIVGIKCIDGLYQRIYGFFLANNADAIVDAGTDEVIFLGVVAVTVAAGIVDSSL